MAHRTVQHDQVVIQTEGLTLEGDLQRPGGATGLVIFAHGSGSSRHSSRNRYVARNLNDAGLATLLFDLLTGQEDVIDRQTRELRFDIPMLSARMAGAVDWAQKALQTEGLRIGLFGASTGAAAALNAAAERPASVAAVVSRGGRPDLAAPNLPRVKAPTRLIVGGEDGPVIGMNREAYDLLDLENKDLTIVPGATHLFEEPGKLDEVARLTAEWFDRFLQP
ncbi:MAG: dienelactone hydrolase family protein [Sumerlaeia bacterium]